MEYGAGNYTYWIIFGGILFALLIFLLFQSLKLTKEVRAVRAQEPVFLLLQQQIDSLRDQVSRSLEGSGQLVQQQLGSLSSLVSGQLHAMANQLSQQVGTGMNLLQKASQHFSERVQEVHLRLAQLDESNRRILEIGKSLASLQEILRAPKIRGGIGEFLLGDLLAQIMPAEYFRLQYAFQGGERVDAVLCLSQGLVPVDAKFPLENFQKSLQAQDEASRKNALRIFAADVKRHIETIAQKYIRPAEGTCDFALMYIPAENVYYEAFIKDEALGEGKSLREFSFQKHVIPVSPNSFYAYLQTILLGLRGMKIEESAKEIINHLTGLRGQLLRFQEEFRKMGKHLEQAKGSYEQAQRQLERFGDQLAAVETPSLFPLPPDDPAKNH
jgi:DNA recombination protein RmuC